MRNGCCSAFRMRRPFRGGKGARMLCRPTMATRMDMERLEDRVVPAVSPSNAAAVKATLQGGVLTVTGTPGPDVVQLRHEYGQLLVAGRSFPVGWVQRVVIATYQGGDVILVASNVHQPGQIFAGNGNDWV